ncbi:MAG: hypothetical protein MJ068_01120 [Clostridia bacterium]|nr:hypothetical protein [Clostridia bacterium]
MPPEKYDNPDILTNPELRNELAHVFAENLNGTMSQLPFEQTGFTPITEQEINDMLADQSMIDTHLQAKELTERTKKQHEILDKYDDINMLKLPEDKWYYTNVKTIMFTFLDPSGTPEAKEKNDKLFERIKNEGDGFLVKKALDICTNFDYNLLFETDPVKKMQIYKEHQDELNVMFAINRNIGPLINDLPEEAQNVYKNNLKIIESASNINQFVESAASPVYLLIPQNKLKSAIAAATVVPVINPTIQEYAKAGVNLGNYSNKLMLLSNVANSDEECKKIKEAMKSLPDKDILKVKAKVKAADSDEYKELTNAEALIAITEGKDVQFTVDETGAKKIREAEFKPLTPEKKFALAKLDVKEETYHVAETARFSALLEKLKGTHTIVSWTRFSTDSEAFENLEESLETFVDLTSKIKSRTLDDMDNVKVYLDAYKDLEEKAGKYYHEKLSQSKNSRRQQRFDIAKEIFEAMDSRSMEGLLNPTKAELAHKQHIEVMEASDVTNNKAKDTSKAVEKLNKGFDIPAPAQQPNAPKK